MAAKTRSPIRTAVAGLGRAGWDIHVRAIRGRRDFVLTDVIEPEAARRKEAQSEFGCRAYTDYRKFLREADTELVVIATQSQDHARQSIQALRAGFHVLCEKPMAVNLREADRVIKEADRVIKEAEKRKNLFTVHQSARFSPELIHIQKVIKSGKLGKVFQIKRYAHVYARRNDWQTLRKYGGGLLNNNGVHSVDQVCQLLDSPVKDVFGDLQQIINPGDADDHFKIVIRAESGVMIDVESSYACALPLPNWVIMGSRGTLMSDGETSTLRYTKARKLPKMEAIDSHMVATRKYGSGEAIEFKEETMPSAEQPKRNFYDYLYDSIRKGKPLFVTPESVRQTMYVLHQARKGTAFR